MNYISQEKAYIAKLVLMEYAVHNGPKLKRANLRLTKLNPPDRKGDSWFSCQRVKLCKTTCCRKILLTLYIIIGVPMINLNTACAHCYTSSFFGPLLQKNHVKFAVKLHATIFIYCSTVSNKSAVWWNIFFIVLERFKCSQLCQLVWCLQYVERNTLVKRSNFTYEVDDNNFQELRNVNNPK